MARGLSDTQKTILRVISEMPVGSNQCEINHKIKSTLFPDLYINSKRWYYGSVKNYGRDTDKKNSARVIMRKSLKRLAQRELITIDDDRCIYLSPKGVKLMANVVELIGNH